MTSPSQLGSLGGRPGWGQDTELLGCDGSCPDKLTVPEQTVTPIFPRLPWLLEGWAVLGPYFHVASTGWRRGWSCGRAP